MKKFILVLGVFAMITSCKNDDKKTTTTQALTIEQGEKAVKDSANFTTLQWVDSTFKDLGKVKLGQTIEVPFTVKNTGNKPLVISSVQPGCGCTVAEKPEKPIMPGQEEKIIAKFNSTGQAVGTQQKNIHVVANTKPFTEHLLNFKVEVTN